MNLLAINSDKEFRDHGVPFSCCNINSLLPCVHTQMTEADVKTINSHGCSKILSHILIRIVVFGYIMTALVIIVYLILLYFIIKVYNLYIIFYIVIYLIFSLRFLLSTLKIFHLLRFYFILFNRRRLNEFTYM